MSTSEINDALRDQLTATLAAGITEDAMKGLKKKVNDLLYEIEADIDYRLKDDLAPNLVAYVAEMAQRTVESILAGNESEMRRYLGCERGAWTGRSDSRCYGAQRDIADWHSVIHGKLFEQGAVALRAKIAEVHRDLIANERILDLEDQVRSLVAQVNKANAEKEAMWQRLVEVGA